MSFANSQQVMSLLPLNPLLPGALPPDRRATPQPAGAGFARLPQENCYCLINLSPVSTETGESQIGSLRR